MCTGIASSQQAMQLVALAPNGHPYRIGLSSGIDADDLEAVDPGIEITATLRERADLEMTRLLLFLVPANAIHQQHRLGSLAARRFARNPVAAVG